MKADRVTEKEKQVPSCSRQRGGQVSPRAIHSEKLSVLTEERLGDKQETHSLGLKRTHQ